MQTKTKRFLKNNSEFRLQKDVTMIMTDSCGENIKIICIIWEGGRETDNMRHIEQIQTQGNFLIELLCFDNVEKDKNENIKKD